MVNNKCIVVLSHSSYSDIWELTINSFKTKIENSADYDYYITTNLINNEQKKLLSENNFSYLTYSENISWGESFKEIGNTLYQLNYDYILFSYDDLIILNIDSKKLLGIFNSMKSNDLDYVQIKNGYRSWFNISKLYFNEKLHLVNDNDTYKGSLVFSIISKDLLLRIINVDELISYSPWQYEISIHKFLKGIQFYCVPKSIVEFSNVIIKGQIDKFALKRALKNNLVKYNGKRDFFDNRNLIKFKLKEIVFVVGKNLIPNYLFGLIRNFKNK